MILTKDVAIIVPIKDYAICVVKLIWEDTHEN